jgi:hypothetical protein
MNDLPEFESMEKLCFRCDRIIGLECTCPEPLLEDPQKQASAEEDVRETEREEGTLSEPVN